MKRKLFAGGLICLTFAATPGLCLFDEIWQLIAIYNSLQEYKRLYDEVSAVVRHPGSIMGAVDQSLRLGEQATAGTSASARIEVLRGTIQAERTIMAELSNIQTLSSTNAAAYGSLLSQMQATSQELQALERQNLTDINRTQYAAQSFISNTQIPRTHRWQ